MCRPRIGTAMSEQLSLFENFKVCRDCKVRKPVSDFTRLNSGTDNRRGSCKACERAKLKSTDSYNTCECGAIKRDVSKRCWECHVTHQDGITEKNCNRCCRTLPIESFAFRRKRGGVVPRSRCKACEAEVTRETRAKWCPTKRRIVRQRSLAVEKRQPRKQQRRRRVAQYCRTLGHDAHTAQRIATAESLATECHICGKPVSATGTLHVDHDHTTNDIRGFLCSSCNTALGHFGDSIETLKSAVRYLRRKPLT